MRNTRARPEGVEEACVTTGRLIEKVIAELLLLRILLYDLGLQSPVQVHSSQEHNRPDTSSIGTFSIDRQCAISSLAQPSSHKNPSFPLPTQLSPYLVFSNIGFLSDHDLRIGSHDIQST